ncbi:hypothetical protein SAMN05192575_109117 [Nocardioides alpinus]|uniref:Uncharacterized protein n=1 Tax=Nocardioides alpinus TaxID=748909 RepID=A0A1I1APE1_9ACTN|nr:hypothetical protein SAMN05192575_109117 [Nocardioides alpinus]
MISASIAVTIHASLSGTATIMANQKLPTMTDHCTHHRTGTRSRSK